MVSVKKIKEKIRWSSYFSIRTTKAIRHGLTFKRILSQNAPSETIYHIFIMKQIFPKESSDGISR